MINIAYKDPAFLFYPSDFYFGTKGMSDEQVGQYIRLLCLQHQIGYLTEEIMLETMHGNFDNLIVKKFQKKKDGKYYNARLVEEISNRSTFVNSRRENGKKGGRPPKKAKPSENHMVNGSLSKTKPSGDELKCNEMNRDELSKKSTGDVETTSRTRAEKTELEKALDDFVDMRKKIKKPVTDRAMNTIKNKLQEMAPGDEVMQVRLIEQSIEHCWQTVYPLKDDRPHNGYAAQYPTRQGKNIYADLAEEARAEESFLNGVIDIDPK